MRRLLLEKEPQKGNAALCIPVLWGSVQSCDLSNPERQEEEKTQ